MIFAKSKVIFLNYFEVYNIKNKLKWQHIEIILDRKHSQHKLF